MILFYNKSNQLLRREYAQKVLINAITATEMCLIPFYLGMKKFNYTSDNQFIHYCCFGFLSERGCYTNQSFD